MEAPRGSVALCVGLSLALSAGGPTAERYPAEGTTLRRVVTRVIDFDSSRMFVRVDGEEVKRFLGTTIEPLEEERVVVLDEYLDVDEDGPVCVTRTFCEGDLEGAVVAFERSETADEYDASLVDGDVCDQQLDRMKLDMDLRAVLPPDRRRTGERWELDVAEALLLRDFDGATVLVRSGHGKIEGLFDDHGVEVRVMKLAAAFEVVERNEDVRGGPFMGIPIDVRETITSELALKGELVWNEHGGHLHGLELRGDVVRTRRVELGESTQPLIYEVVTPGAVELTLSVSRVDG